MAKVIKLTPQRLKRIIAEEKRKLKIGQRRNQSTASKKRVQSLNKNNLKIKIKALHELKKHEIKAAKRFKKLYEIRKLIKQHLLRSL